MLFYCGLRAWPAPHTRRRAHRPGASNSGGSPEPWLSELSELSDYCRCCRGTVGDCRATVGPLSGHCRATVGATVGCDGVRPPVRQSPNCRVVSELSESLSELSGYCRATVGLLSGPLLGLVTRGGSSVPFLIWDSLPRGWPFSACRRSCASPDHLRKKDSTVRNE